MCYRGRELYIILKEIILKHIPRFTALSLNLKKLLNVQKYELDPL